MGPNSDGGSFWSGAGSAAYYRDAGANYVQPVTLECWIWPVWSGAVAQGYFAITTSNSFTLELGIDANGNAHAFSSSAALTIPTLIRQSWHHLVLVDTGGVNTFYLDGVSGATGAGASFGSRTITTVIGAGGTAPAPTRFPNGFLSEVAFYNTGLSAARVLAHYNAADQRAQLPVYQGSAQFNPSTAGINTATAQLTAIYANMFSTYQNSP